MSALLFVHVGQVSLSVTWLIHRQTAHFLLKETYKQRLNDILNDVILISEIADLSVQSATIANAMGLQIDDRKHSPKHSVHSTSPVPVTRRISAVHWSEVRFKSEDNMSQLGSENDLSAKDTGKALDADEAMSIDDVDLGTDDDSGASPGFYDSSSRLPIMDLLDKWEDPMNKRDKVNFVPLRFQCLAKRSFSSFVLFVN